MRKETPLQHHLPKRPQWMRVAQYAWGTVLTIITLVVAGVFLLAAFSDHVSPRSFLYLSYLGIAFPVVWTVAAVWCVMLLLMHRWWLMAGMLLTLAVGYEPTTRFLPVPSREATAAGDTTEAPTLRLMTYNTMRMGQTRLSKRAEAVPIVDFLKQSDADIVCLQEYGFSLSAGGHTEQRIRKDLSKRYPYYHYLPYSGVKASGIALYSRYPIRSAHRIDTHRQYFAAMLYHLNVQGRDVALINYHLHSNSIKPADRVFYDNMVEHFEADSLDRIHYNLVRQLGRAYLARTAECEAIDSVRRSLGDEVPVLICGDMNDTPVSYSYHTIRGDFADTWVERGFGPGITFYKHKLWFRIDHIFHSRQLRPVDIDVLTRCHYSDHYPVVATFQLTSQEN
jgi:endonuclease/exonuclease/phosphatase family metal-dependent hydrolase